VAEFMARWLGFVRNKVEPRTYELYEQKVRNQVVPDLGHVKLAELRPLHIEQAEARWLAEGNRRTGGGLSAQSVLHLHRCLHTALDRAVKWRLIAVNPCDGVDAPHVPETEMGFLTVSEAERLVTTLIGKEYELPILVGLYGGLRPAEYLALRWTDLDLEAGELRVMRNVHRAKAAEGGFRFGPTKTHRSRRPVSMPPTVVELLRAWRPVQAEQRLSLGPAWYDLDLVFTDAVGRPLSLDRVRYQFYAVLDDTGLRRVRLYDLRHTMATLVLAETKNLKLVAARLGHANETLVLRRYGHLLPGADREAADRLGEVVRRREAREG
jgi:integrase